jgi:hypothetical protein
VTPQSASNHLAKLLEGGLLAVEAEGRHRYYRLASPQVATVMEALAHLAPPIRSLDAPLTPKAREPRRPNGPPSPCEPYWVAAGPTSQGAVAWSLWPKPGSFLSRS